MANGIGSSLSGFKTAGDIQVQDSSYAIARVAFPRDTIKAGSPASVLLENIETYPQFRTYLAHDIHLILFLTEDWVAWAYTHKVIVFYAKLNIINSGKEQRYSERVLGRSSRSGSPFKRFV